MYTDPNRPPFYEGQEVVGWHPLQGSLIKHMQEYTITSCHFYNGNPVKKYFWYVGVHDKEGNAHGYPDPIKYPHLAHLGFITPRIFRAKADLQIELIMTFEEIKKIEIKELLLMN